MKTNETVIARHGWKIILVVILFIGFFGVNDMIKGASDLQTGEAVYMRGVTGMSWDDLRAASPNVARLIDTLFRTNGATLATVALLSLSICLTAYREGDRWAWFALWSLPFWLISTVSTILAVEKQPGAGTPVPVISGSIFFVITSLTLLLDRPRFFASNIRSDAALPENLEG